jgi:hypothetical protein
MRASLNRIGEGIVPQLAVRENLIAVRDTLVCV